MHALSRSACPFFSVIGGFGGLGWLGGGCGGSRIRVGLGRLACDLWTKVLYSHHGAV